MNQFETWTITDLDNERKKYREYLQMALREGLTQAESWAKYLDSLNLEITARTNKNLY